jgi:hypothetical protein
VVRSVILGAFFLALLLGAQASALADQEVELSPGGIQCVSPEQCAFADQPDKPWLNLEP